MKVWDVTEEEIRAAAEEVGLRIWGYPNGVIVRDGRALRFRVGVNQTSPRDEQGLLPFQRYSMLSGRRRRLASVCWHGHKRFMLALFRWNPDARIQTTLADYRGKEHFLATHKLTQGRGNEWNYSGRANCGCGHGVTRRPSVLLGDLLPSVLWGEGDPVAEAAPNDYPF